MVKYNAKLKSNSSNLLNMHCLDGDNVEKIAAKHSSRKYLWPFPFAYLSVPACSGVWWWSWYRRHSPPWPWWLARQCKMKQAIDRCYRSLHDNAAAGRYGNALAVCAARLYFKNRLLIHFSGNQCCMGLSVTGTSWWNTRPVLVFRRTSPAAHTIQLEICWSPERSPLMHVREAISSSDSKWDDKYRAEKEREKCVDRIFITHWAFSTGAVTYTIGVGHLQAQK